MNTRRHLFTSESVSEGHPDKIADQISDAILDAFLAEEPEAKVACETLVADNLVVITGEFKTVRKELFDEVRGRAEAHRPPGAARHRLSRCRNRHRPQHLRSAGALQSPVDPDSQGHHAGRRRHRRRRPGADVRLCLRRNARPDAVPDLAGAPSGAEAGRAAQVRRLAVAASRCQKPGHRGLRRAENGRRRNRDHLHPDRARPRPGLGRAGSGARNRRSAGAGRAAHADVTGCGSIPPARSKSAAPTATPA